MGSIGTEASSGLRHYVGVVRRWWLLLLISTAFTVGIAALALVTAPQRYTSHAEVLLSQPELVNNPVVAAETVTKLNDLMPTYAALVESDVVLDGVRRETGIGGTLDDLRADVTVEPVPESLLLGIDVQREDEDEALSIGQAVIEQFTANLGRIVAATSGDSEVAVTAVKGADVEPVPDNRARTLAVAFVLGFGLAAVAAFALDRA